MIELSRVIPALLILSGLLGNQSGYPVVMLIGVFSYYLATLIGIFFLIVESKNNILVYLIISIYIFIRIINIILAGESSYTSNLSIASNFILYSAIGSVYFIKNFNSLNSQIKIYFLITCPVILFQFIGLFPFLHEWNTLFITVDIFGEIQRGQQIILNHFLLTRDELYEINGAIFSINFPWQIRPPGLTHSNQILSLWILIAWSFNLGNRLANKISFYDLLLVVITILTGSKLSIFGSLILIFMSISVKKMEKIKLIIYFIIFLAFELLLFPGAFYTNFSTSNLEVSFLFRIIDLILYFYPEAIGSIDLFGDIYNMYFSIFVDPNYVPGNYSGAIQLINIIPFILVLSFLMIPKYLKIMKIIRNYSLDQYMVLRLIPIPCLMALFSGNFLTSQLYAFFCGIALLPFYIIFINSEFSGMGE